MSHNSLRFLTMVPSTTEEQAKFICDRLKAIETESVSDASGDELLDKDGYTVVIPQDCDNNEIYKELCENLPKEPFLYDIGGLEEKACSFDIKENFNVWIYAEDSAELDRVLYAVSKWQERFEIKEPWSMTFAAYCDRPRLDEFDGGIIVCHKGRGAIRWASHFEDQIIALLAE